MANVVKMKNGCNLKHLGYIEQIFYVHRDTCVYLICVFKIGQLEKVNGRGVRLQWLQTNFNFTSWERGQTAVTADQLQLHILGGGSDCSDIYWQLNYV